MERPQTYHDRTIGNSVFRLHCPGSACIHTAAMELNLSLNAALRLSLLYAHLLLCVFALQTVLSTDWRLLRSRISASQLQQAQRRVEALLLGLWLTGTALVLLDSMAQFDPSPKLLAKLACVCLLTFNGVLLRLWCFPRLVSERPLARLEACALMACGAVSTTTWLMAGFYGIARPLTQWPLELQLLLLAAALAVALPLAMLLSGRLSDGRRARLRGRAAREFLDTEMEEFGTPAGGQPIEAHQP